ncbi:MAG: calcium/sodium antiporter, partial [Cyanobacteria bacterium P01_H01_bin.15]
FVIGVTIVSIGTSLPELITSLVAVQRGSSEIVLSNVVGSNIANIFLIVGIASIISSKILRITFDLVSVDLPIFVGSAFLLTLAIWDGNFSFGEAVLFFAGYIFYVFYLVRGNSNNQLIDSDTETQLDLPQDAHGPLWKLFLVLIASSLFIYVGADYSIKSLFSLSELIQVGREVLAVTAVAIGTSLPELMVTITAALKGNAEIAVGNVLGSNVFNIFVVMGIPGMIEPLDIPVAVLHRAIPTMLAGTLLLFFTTQDKKLTIWEGWLFIIFYVWFLGQTFNWL